MNAHVRPKLSPAWPKGLLWKIEHLMPGDRDIHQRPGPPPACFVCCLPSLILYTVPRCWSHSLISGIKEGWDILLVLLFECLLFLALFLSVFSHSYIFFCNHLHASSDLSCLERDKDITVSWTISRQISMKLLQHAIQHIQHSRLNFEWQLPETHWEYQEETKNNQRSGRHAN